MKITYKLISILLFLAINLISCSSDDETPVSENNPAEAPTEQINEKSSESLATNGCSNVVIFNGHAYAACGEQMEIVSLVDGKRNIVSIASNDITIDPSNKTLFVQARNMIHALSIDNPMLPTIIDSNNTNFGAFSGIGSANGIIVISGGTRGSDSQVYTFENNTLNLVNDGITAVDDATGNPDVHVTETANGAKAFYSQDLGSVTNWGIQIVEFDKIGAVQSTPNVITLTPRPFSGGFSSVSPANFPVESEFLNNKLYVAHFAINGIEVIDLEKNTLLSQIPLGYQPINITTDNINLFAIGITHKTISMVNPTTREIKDISIGTLQQPRGIAVSSNYIAVADKIEGLIIGKR